MMVLLVLAAPALALKLAIGSCSGSMGRKNPKIWKTIEDWHPDAYVWLGDAIYADKMKFPLMFWPTSREAWEGKYNAQLAEPTYASLRNSTRILGVWDDHDFGQNNMDSTFEHKDLARELYLNFLGEPADSPRRTNPGINVQYMFEEFGKKNRVFFGDEQLRWLKKQLDTPADVYLIMNGSQFLTQDCLFSPSERVYNEELGQILDMIRNKKGVVLASGDVHFGEIKAYPCLNETIHELTSSGLTHSAYTQYGFVSSILINFPRPLTFQVGPRVIGINWGSIEIDLSGNTPTIALALRDDDGNVALEHKFSVGETVGRMEMCKYSRLRRWLAHMCGVFITFAQPLLFLLVALLLFLRKYSHSF